MKKYWVNYSDKPAPYTGLQFPRASVACEDYETAQALVKVYGFWGDRNRITITEKPTGKVSIIDMKPFSRELVENLLETTLKDMGFKVAVEIMEGRHDDLLVQREMKK